MRRNQHVDRSELLVGKYHWQQPDAEPIKVPLYIQLTLSKDANCHPCCVVLSRSIMSNSLQPYGLQPTRLLCPWGFSRQEHWSGSACLPLGCLPNPGIEPRSPSLQVDSWPSELLGTPRILEWVAYPFSRRTSQPRISCIVVRFFTI